MAYQASQPYLASHSSATVLVTACATNNRVESSHLPIIAGAGGNPAAAGRRRSRRRAEGCGGCNAPGAPASPPTHLCAALHVNLCSCEPAITRPPDRVVLFTPCSEKYQKSGRSCGRANCARQCALTLLSACLHIGFTHRALCCPQVAAAVLEQQPITACKLLAAVGAAAPMDGSSSQAFTEFLVRSIAVQQPNLRFRGPCRTSC